MSPVIRVLLLEPQPLFEAAIRSLLATAADILLIDETLDPLRPVHQAETPYDVMLIDASSDSIWAVIRDLQRHFPALRFILLVEEQSEVLSLGLLEAGVAGCVLKRQISKSLIHAIRAVAEGESWFSRTVVVQLVEAARKPPAHEKPPALTEREWQVLKLLAQQCYSNSQIATALHLSTQRISNLLTSIYAKLGVRRRGEAANWFNRSVRG